MEGSISPINLHDYDHEWPRLGAPAPAALHPDTDDSATVVPDVCRDGSIQDSDVETVSVEIDPSSNDLVLTNDFNHKIYRVEVELLRTVFPDQDLIELAYGAVGDYYVDTLLLFRRWLKHRLPKFHGDDDGIDKNYLAHIIELYALALDHDLLGLQNTIMDRICARETCEEGYFSKSLVARVYTATYRESKLRIYLIHHFMYKTSTWLFEEVALELRKHKQYGNIDFFDDVYAECQKALRDAQPYGNPNQAGRCYYHEHHEWDICESDIE